MNFCSIKAIFLNEMERSHRTKIQSYLSPVISTLLYTLIFGSVMNFRMGEIQGTPYGIYVIPGLIMLNAIGLSLLAASFGIFMQKFTGAIYEILSAPVSYQDVLIAYMGAASTKAFLVCLTVFSITQVFSPFPIAHPIYMILILILSILTFSLCGFLLGLFAENFEQIHLIPNLIITPLIFLGGTFFNIQSLPPFWRMISLFNPLAYIIDTFRWTFFDTSQFAPQLGFIFLTLIFTLCYALVITLCKKGYGIRT